MTVTDKKYYADFGRAWQDLGQQLLPGINSVEEEERVYAQFFGKEDIETYGVVVVQLKLK